MSRQRTVLIADDEPLKVLTLEEHLHEAGYKVLSAVDGNEALELLRSKTIDALVTDVRMPGLDGLSLLAESIKSEPARPVLVMTGYEDVRDAVRAMKVGAMDYMVKPISGEEIVARLDRAFADADLLGENLILRREVQRLGGQTDPVIVGEDMARVCQGLDKAAATDATVLIVGETGTGKEICARYLHRRSGRVQGPFVVVPCAALSQTLIESELFGHERGAFTGAVARRNGYFTNADGGTVLLDDVDDLPLDIQGKLLHVLQARTFQRVGGTRSEQVDVRVVAATKKDLATLVENRSFRDDLMYRLSVVTIRIPPLRDRRQDIVALTSFFLKCSAARLGRKAYHLTEDAMRLLMNHDWPGNVRELEHAIESTVTMNSGPEIAASDLPLTIRARRDHPLFSLHTQGKSEISLEDALLDFERALLTWAFEKAGRNQGQAAKLLGIPRSTFQYRWSKAFEEAKELDAVKRGDER